MKILCALGLIISILGGAGCGEQDPFAGEEERVQKRIPAEKVTVAVPPLSNVVFFDVDFFYDVEEGVEKTIPYQVRIGDPRLELLDFEILDLEKTLPGATLTENPNKAKDTICLLYTSPSPRDRQKSRMPSSA